MRKTKPYKKRWQKRKSYRIRMDVFYKGLAGCMKATQTMYEDFEFLAGYLKKIAS
jgi:hypothetical protein